MNLNACETLLEDLRRFADEVEEDEYDPASASISISLHGDKEVIQMYQDEICSYVKILAQNNYPDVEVNVAQSLDYTYNLDN